MRFYSVILFLLLPCLVFGAIPATVHWNVQTTGAATNAGGFDYGGSSCGTDESTGAGTAVTLTIDGSDSTKGTMSPAITSTTHGPCNTIIIASGSGCTVSATSTYVMTSQAAGVGTFDRSMGTVGSVCTGVMGGTTTPIHAASVANGGNTIDVKTGTYTVTAAINFAINGAGGVISVEPYSGSPGDGGGTVTWTTATNSVNLITSGANSMVIKISRMTLTNTAGTKGIGIRVSNAGSSAWVVNSVLDGFTTGISQTSTQPARVMVMNSEIKNCTTAGISGSGNSVDVGLITVFLFNSWVHDNAVGVIAGNGNNGGGFMGWNSVISANTGDGLQTSGTTGNNIRMTHMTIANNGGDGADISTGTYQNFQMDNSVVYGNTGVGVKLGSPGVDPIFFTLNNGYGGNNGGDFSGLSAGTGDVTTVAVSPFVSSTNFALNSSPTGGYLLKKAGVPGASLFGTGASDMGAVQTSGISSGQVACPTGQ